MNLASVFNCKILKLGCLKRTNGNNVSRRVSRKHGHGDGPNILSATVVDRKLVKSRVPGLGVKSVLGVGVSVQSLEMFREDVAMLKLMSLKTDFLSNDYSMCW